MWAIGQMFYELVTGKSLDRLSQRLLGGHLSRQALVHLCAWACPNANERDALSMLPTFMADTIARCLSGDPAIRPDLDSLLRVFDPAMSTSPAVHALEVFEVLHRSSLFT